MIDPRLMCKQHITGEHGEIHKHLHNFIKHHSISGRVQPGQVQIEPMAMKQRHDELAQYLNTHKSPYEQPDLDYLPEHERKAEVNINQSIRDLYHRCPKCRSIMNERGIAL